MFVGVGASRVGDMFEQGKSIHHVLFLLRIDAVGRSRGAGLGGGNDERENIKSTPCRWMGLILTKELFLSLQPIDQMF